MSLSREFRQVLAELELLSHGKTASYNSSGAGETTAVLPHGELKPPHDYWRDRYHAAGKHERPGILEHAQRELEIWKKRQAPAEDSWNERDAILTDGEGFEASVVARRFGRSTTYVMKLRTKDDREAEFGLPTQFARAKDNSAERVQNLASRGCTLNQIAMQTGLHKTQVQRILKKAA